MEYCPYCQRWVEPTKGNTDVLAGHALGGWMGTIMGTGHYLLKGSRCPICNNIIKGLGAPGYAYPQPAYYQYPQATRPYPARGPYTPPARASSLKKCVRCATTIRGTSVFCPHCGARQL